MNLAKKLLIVPLLTFPFIFNSVPEKITENKKQNLTEFSYAKKKMGNVKNNSKHTLDKTLTNEEIKDKQEKYFEEVFNTDLGNVKYEVKDLPSQYQMIIKGEDSIHIDKTVSLWNKRNVLLHEYAHLKQKDIKKKLEELNIYNHVYDDTTNNIYAIFIYEGGAESAQYLATGKEPGRKTNYTALCRARDAGMNRRMRSGEFYTTAANFIYPLMKKQGLEKTTVGLFTTDPPSPSVFWNEKTRKEYLKKVEKNSEKYSSIILDK